MIKKIDVSNYLYVLIMLFAFGCGTAIGQNFINGDFNDKIAKDIVVVEFWADWNSSNQFNDLHKLKECEKYRLDIMANADTQAEYNVST